MTYIREVSADVKMSVRTLQRRLEVEGLRFRDVVDDARYREASRQLAHDRKSLAQIATSLGYSHPSHFNRAFRRWSGMSPSAYRALHSSKR